MGDTQEDGHTELFSSTETSGRALLRAVQDFSVLLRNDLKARGHRGLAWRHADVLAHLDFDGMPLSLLAKRAHIPLPLIRLLVAEMEEVGYLDCEHDVVRLSAAGEVLLRDAQNAVRDIFAENARRSLRSNSATAHLATIAQLMQRSTGTEKPEATTTRESMAALVAQFESCALPRLKWTHQAHLTVAFWYLYHYPHAEAIPLIRDGIQRYNDLSGVVTTDTEGYHETITRFYIWAVSDFLERHRESEHGDLAALLMRFLSEHGDKRYPLEFYSRERLLSREARYSWIEPDIKPLG